MTCIASFYFTSHKSNIDKTTKSRQTLSKSLCFGTQPTTHVWLVKRMTSAPTFREILLENTHLFRINVGFHCEIFEENEKNGQTLHGLAMQGRGGGGKYGEKLYNVSFSFHSGGGVCAHRFHSRKRAKTLYRPCFYTWFIIDVTLSRRVLAVI